MEAKYNLKHAKEILEPCGLLGENQRGKYLRIKKRGVMPAIKRDLLLLNEAEGLRWQTLMPYLSPMPNGSRSSRRCAVAARWVVAPRLKLPCAWTWRYWRNSEHQAMAGKPASMKP